MNATSSFVSAVQGFDWARMYSAAAAWKWKSSESEQWKPSTGNSGRLEWGPVRGLAVVVVPAACVEVIREGGTAKDGVHVLRHNVLVARKVFEEEVHSAVGHEIVRGEATTVGSGERRCKNVHDSERSKNVRHHAAENECPARRFDVSDPEMNDNFLPGMVGRFGEIALPKGFVTMTESPYVENLKYEETILQK